MTWSTTKKRSKTRRVKEGYAIFTRSRGNVVEAICNDGYGYGGNQYTATREKTPDPYEPDDGVGDVTEDHMLVAKAICEEAGWKLPSAYARIEVAGYDFVFIAED